MEVLSQDSSNSTDYSRVSRIREMEKMVAYLEGRRNNLIKAEKCMRMHVNQMESKFLAEMETRQKKLHKLLEPERPQKPQCCPTEREQMRIRVHRLEAAQRELMRLIAILEKSDTTETATTSSSSYSVPQKRNAILDLRKVIDQELIKKQDTNQKIQCPLSNSNKILRKTNDSCDCGSSDKNQKIQCQLSNSNKFSNEANDTCDCDSNSSLSYYKNNPPPMPLPVIEIALCKRKPQLTDVCNCDSEDSCQEFSKAKSCPVILTPTKASCKAPAPCQKPAPCSIGQRPCDNKKPCQDPPPCLTVTDTLEPPICARRGKSPCETCQTTRNLKSNISKCSNIQGMITLLKNASLHLNECENCKKLIGPTLEEAKNSIKLMIKLLKEKGHIFGDKDLDKLSEMLQEEDLGVIKKELSIEEKEEIEKKESSEFLSVGELEGEEEVEISAEGEQIEDEGIEIEDLEKPVEEEIEGEEIIRPEEEIEEMLGEKGELGKELEEKGLEEEKIDSGELDISLKDEGAQEDDEQEVGPVQKEEKVDVDEKEKEKVEVEKKEEVEVPEKEEDEIEVPEKKEEKIDVPEKKEEKIEEPEKKEEKIEVPEKEEEKIQVPEKKEEKIEVLEKEEEKIEIPEKKEEKIEVPEKKEEKIEVPEKKEEKIEVPEKEEEKIEVPEKKEEKIEVPEKEEEIVDVTGKEEEKIEVPEKKEEKVDVTEKEEEKVDVTEKEEEKVGGEEEEGKGDEEKVDLGGEKEEGIDIIEEEGEEGVGQEKEVSELDEGGEEQEDEFKDIVSETEEIKEGDKDEEGEWKEDQERESEGEKFDLAEYEEYIEGEGFDDDIFKGKEDESDIEEAIRKICSVCPQKPKKSKDELLLELIEWENKCRIKDQIIGSIADELLQINRSESLEFNRLKRAMKNQTDGLLPDFNIELLALYIEYKKKKLKRKKCKCKHLSSKTGKRHRCKCKRDPEMEEMELLLGLQPNCVACDCGPTCENDKPKSKLQGVKWHENICAECTGDPCPCENQQTNKKIEESCDCPDECSEECEFVDAEDGDKIDTKDQYQTVSGLETVCECDETLEETCGSIQKQQIESVTTKLKCIFDRTNLCECSRTATCKLPKKEFNFMEFIKNLTKPKCRCGEELCNCNDVLGMQPNWCSIKHQEPISITDDNVATDTDDLQCGCSVDNIVEKYPCVSNEISQKKPDNEYLVLQEMIRNIKPCECEKNADCLQKKQETQSCECGNKSQKTGILSGIKSLFERKQINCSCDNQKENKYDDKPNLKVDTKCTCERAVSGTKLCDCVISATRIIQIEATLSNKPEEAIVESKEETLLNATITPSEDEQEGAEENINDGIIEPIAISQVAYQTFESNDNNNTEGRDDERVPVEEEKQGEIKEGNELEEKDQGDEKKTQNQSDDETNKDKKKGTSHSKCSSSKPSSTCLTKISLKPVQVTNKIKICTSTFSATPSAYTNKVPCSKESFSKAKDIAFSKLNKWNCPLAKPIPKTCLPSCTKYQNVQKEKKITCLPTCPSISQKNKINVDINQDKNNEEIIHKEEDEIKETVEEKEEELIFYDTVEEKQDEGDIVEENEIFEDTEEQENNQEEPGDTEKLEPVSESQNIEKEESLEKENKEITDEKQLVNDTIKGGLEEKNQSKLCLSPKTCAKRKPIDSSNIEDNRNLGEKQCPVDCLLECPAKKKEICLPTCPTPKIIEPKECPSSKKDKPLKTCKDSSIILTKVCSVRKTKQESNIDFDKCINIKTCAAVKNASTKNHQVSLSAPCLKKIPSCPSNIQPPCASNIQPPCVSNILPPCVSNIQPPCAKNSYDLFNEAKKIVKKFIRKLRKDNKCTCCKERICSPQCSNFNQQNISCSNIHNKTQKSNKSCSCTDLNKNNQSDLILHEQCDPNQMMLELNIPQNKRIVGCDVFFNGKLKKQMRTNLYNSKLIQTLQFQEQSRENAGPSQIQYSYEDYSETCDPSCFLENLEEYEYEAYDQLVICKGSCSESSVHQKTSEKKICSGSCSSAQQICDGTCIRNDAVITQQVSRYNHIQRTANIFRPTDQPINLNVPWSLPSLYTNFNIHNPNLRQMRNPIGINPFEFSKNCPPQAICDQSHAKRSDEIEKRELKRLRRLSESLGKSYDCPPCIEAPPPCPPQPPPCAPTPPCPPQPPPCAPPPCVPTPPCGPTPPCAPPPPPCAKPPKPPCPQPLICAQNKSACSLGGKTPPCSKQLSHSNLPACCQPLPPPCPPPQPSCPPSRIDVTTLVPPCCVDKVKRLLQPPCPPPRRCPPPPPCQPPQRKKSPCPLSKPSTSKKNVSFCSISSCKKSPTRPRTPPCPLPRGRSKSASSYRDQKAPYSTHSSSSCRSEASSKGSNVECLPQGSGNMNLRVMRQIASDGLLLEWDLPKGISGVTGYEIEIDGNIVYHVRSGNRKQAILFHLNLKCCDLIITLFAINACGRLGNVFSSTIYRSI